MVPNNVILNKAIIGGNFNEGLTFGVVRQFFVSLLSRKLFKGKTKGQHFEPAGV
jgi:hypothetical protein